MSAMGLKIDQFDVPVCNSFRPTIFYDQHCYEVDPNEYKNIHNVDVESDLKIGLVFLLDFNEDRQVSFLDPKLQEKENLYGKFIQSTNLDKALIILNTIGKI